VFARPRPGAATSTAFFASGGLAFALTAGLIWGLQHWAL
jgi:hypothetical protein